MSDSKIDLSRVFFPKSLISKEFQRIHRCIRKHLDGEFRHLNLWLFHLVPIRSFVGDTDYARLIRISDIKRVLTREVVSFALVQRGSWQPVGALLMSSNKSLSNRASNLLRNLNIFVGEISDENCDQSIHSFLTMIQGSNFPIQKSFFEAKEKKYFEHFKRWFDPETQKVVRVVPECALSSFIDALEIGEALRDIGLSGFVESLDALNELRTNEDSRLSYLAVLDEFRRKSSVDFLCLWNEDLGQTNEVRDGWWPAMGIEIDGSVHRTDRKKKISDEKKDDLFRIAKIPLMRINTDLSDLHKDSDFDRDKETRAIQDEYVRFLMARFSEALPVRHRREDLENFLRLQNEKRLAPFRARFNALLSSGLTRQEALARSGLNECLHEISTDAIDWAEEFEHLHIFQRYEEVYGRPPNIEISIDQNGYLSGRLGNWQLPPIPDFCRVVGATNLDRIRIEFARDWLVRQALGDNVYQ